MSGVRTTVCKIVVTLRLAMTARCLLGFAVVTKYLSTSTKSWLHKRPLQQRRTKWNSLSRSGTH